MKIKEKWTLDKIKEGFISFYNEFGHYPTSTEIDGYKDLPSSRQIQRKFGGLPNLRKQLGIGGQLDYTKGQHSSDRANKINTRAHKIEKEVYNYLISMFGLSFVHREFFFNDDRRTRTDFYVYHKTGTFSVDTFYPSTIRNLNHCLNSKLASYKGLEIKYPIIFLMMNESISEDETNRLIGNKINKLKSNQSLMTFSQFKDYCNTLSKAK